MLITQEEFYPVIFTGNGKAPDDDYEKFAENIEDFEYIQLPANPWSTKPRIMKT